MDATYRLIDANGATLHEGSEQHCLENMVNAMWPTGPVRVVPIELDDEWAPGTPSTTICELCEQPLTPPEVGVHSKCAAKEAAWAEAKDADLTKVGPNLKS